MPAQPLYLTAPSGRLFVLRYVAADRTGHDVVIVPPFAEEMNKSRRMLSLQAQALHALGIGVVVFDLSGTGESEGDFSRATLAHWKEDVRTVLAWLMNEGSNRVSLLGVRFGALLAMTVAHESRMAFDSIVHWQPYISGQLMMTQFLRLRLAAGMLEGKSMQETTQTLRDHLSHGESIEVAGYTLSPDLVAEIDRMHMEPLVEVTCAQMHWLDLIAAKGLPTPVASQRMVDRLRQKITNIYLETVVGEPFWSLPEITLAPALLARTTEILRSTTENG